METVVCLLASFVFCFKYFLRFFLYCKSSTNHPGGLFISNIIERKVVVVDLQHLPSPLDDLTNTRLDTTVVLWLFTVDLALMSYECEAPETQFEKERRKSLRLVALFFYWGWGGGF